MNGIEKKSFKIIEHTADIGIDVSGPSLRDLFVNAAEGMFGLVVHGTGKEGKRIQKISLKAGIKEQLLVKWLEELLFLFEVRRLVPVKFNIAEISSTGLDAEAVCVPFDPKVHSQRHQIKAVTYHDLEVKEVEGCFKVRIIFDI